MTPSPPQPHEPPRPPRSHLPSGLSPARPKKLPTTGTRDVLGSALAFKRDQLGFLAAGVRRHGDLFGFRPLGIPMVLANHPDHIQHILVDGEEKYDKDANLFKIVRPVLRDGLIGVSDKALWSRQRHMMAPHFTPRTVAGFAANMTDETVRMLDHWDHRPDGDETPLDITGEAGQLALRIVNRSLFSADVSKPSAPPSPSAPRTTSPPRPHPARNTPTTRPGCAPPWRACARGCAATSTGPGRRVVTPPHPRRSPPPGRSAMWRRP